VQQHLLHCTTSVAIGMHLAPPPLCVGILRSAHTTPSPSTLPPPPRRTWKQRLSRAVVLSRAPPLSPCVTSRYSNPNTSTRAAASCWSPPLAPPPPPPPSAPVLLPPAAAAGVALAAASLAAAGAGLGLRGASPRHSLGGRVQGVVQRQVACQ
jgi:hypothetical protein